MTSESPEQRTDDVPSTHVAVDLPCAKCGYNLRTLAWDSQCPECGLAVSGSLPPPGFRFQKMATVFRVRRGLALVVIAILVEVSCALALFVMMRHYHKLPPPALRLSVLSYWHISLGVLVISAFGLVLATYPYGWRGDRLLRALGIAVVVLVALPVAAGVAIRLADRPGSLPFGLGWYTYLAATAPFFYCFSVAHVLVWVHLLARVRAAEHQALWSMTFLVLLTQSFLLIQGLCRYANFLINLKGMPGPSGVLSWGGSISDHWLGGWERQINGLAWIVTLFGLWFYLRKLNQAIAGRRAPT